MSVIPTFKKVIADAEKERVYDVGSSLPMFCDGYGVREL